MQSLFALSDLGPPVYLAGLVWLGLAAQTAAVWRQHSLPGQRPFIVTHLALLWWLLAAGLELASPTLDGKTFWALAASPAVTLVCVSWALFLATYMLGLAPKRRWGPVAILVGAPAAVAVIVATNRWHQAFYGPETHLAILAGRPSVVYEHGPLFNLCAAFDYVALSVAVGSVVVAAIRADRRYRGFPLTLLSVTLVPIVCNLSYLLFGVTLFGFDPTPFSFAVILVLISWLILNNRLTDVNVIARDVLFFRSGDPIVVIDKGGALRGANPEARRVFGGDLAIQGAPLTHLPDLGPIVRRLVATGVGGQVRPIERDGRTFDPRPSALINPMRPKGALLGWVIDLVDITAQQANALALRRAVESAEAANLSKSQFLSTVSHELRTPLTSIKGALDLLSQGALGEMPERSRRVIDVATRNSGRLASLIDDLLDLQRIEAGRMEIARLPVDLAQVVRESVEAAEGYARMHGVGLTIVQLDDPAPVIGDHKRLMQVMANVLSNALKFSHRGGEVEVALRRDGDRARVTVRDQGVGIPEDFRARLFEPFQQADASVTRQIGGSGLGMSITWRILAENGGRIDYESTVGVGTTFFIELKLDPRRMG